MKIVDAVWEKRNLDVSCCEIRVFKDDDIKDVISEIKKIEAEYIVVKVPVAQFDLSDELSNLGFKFIETMFTLSHNLNDFDLNEKQKKITCDLSVNIADEKDKDKIFLEIKNGLFSTDRIGIDPFFNMRYGYNRYINWINDEQKKGCSIYTIKYKNQSIGFSAIKNTDNIYHQFLVGIYPDFQGKGLGFSALYKPMNEIKKIDGARFTTGVSSNNMASLKTHINMGCTIDDNEYVFIKHNISKGVSI